MEGAILKNAGWLTISTIPMFDACAKVKHTCMWRAHAHQNFHDMHVRVVLCQIESKSSKMAESNGCNVSVTEQWVRVFQQASQDWKTAGHDHPSSSRLSSPARYPCSARFSVERS